MVMTTPTSLQVVAENYPAEFGDEQLVQQVVEMLLSATEKKSSEPTTDHTHSGLENMDTAGTNIISICV